MATIIKRKHESLYKYLQTLSLADLKALIDLAQAEFDMSDGKIKVTEYWETIMECAYAEFRNRINKIY